jgi:hypothetical protein
MARFRWVLPTLITVGAFVFAIVVAVGGASESLDKAASAGTIAIGRSADVHLDVRTYALSYQGFEPDGDDASLDVPAMNIRVHSPPGAPQLHVRNESHAEVSVNNRGVEQVASVDVTVAGTYRISVTSAEGGSGALVIGSSPSAGAGSALARGAVIFGVGLVLALALRVVTRLMFGRRPPRRSRRGRPAFAGRPNPLGTPMPGSYQPPPYQPPSHQPPSHQPPPPPTRIFDPTQPGYEPDPVYDDPAAG